MGGVAPKKKKKKIKVRILFFLSKMSTGGGVLKTYFLRFFIP